MNDEEFGKIFHEYCQFLKESQDAEISRMVGRLEAFGCTGTIKRFGKTWKLKTVRRKKNIGDE